MAEFIAESPRLLRLDLRENEIKTGGLMALSLALKVNHSLLRLDLDREPKKESVSPQPSASGTGTAMARRRNPPARELNFGAKTLPAPVSPSTDPSSPPRR